MGSYFRDDGEELRERQHTIAVVVAFGEYAMLTEVTRVRLEDE